MQQPVFNRKRQISEQILKILEGRPSKDNQYTINEISLMVEQQLALQIKINLFQNYKAGDAINPGQYVITFEGVPVKKNAARNRSYIDLPARYIDLPGGKGVWSIGPMGNDFDRFIPLKLGSANFSKIYSTPFLQDIVGYEVENMKAYFTKDLALAQITSCLVQLVTTSNTNLDLNITADMDMLVINSVLELLGKEKTPDKVNDESESR